MHNPVRTAGFHDPCSRGEDSSSVATNNKKHKSEDCFAMIRHVFLVNNEVNENKMLGNSNADVCQNCDNCPCDWMMHGLGIINFINGLNLA